jgi:hypothetical protein
MPSKAKARDAAGRDQERINALVRAMAEAINLPVRPEWVPGVANQLSITLAMADLVESVELGDVNASAPAYRL